MLTKQIVDFIEVKKQDAMEDENFKRGMAKAAGFGALDGVLDAIVIVGGLGLIAAIGQTVKDIIKK